MPAYAWMEHSKSDLSLVAGRVAVMSRLGVPYKKADLLNASEAYQDQAEDLVSELNDQDESIDLAWDSELAALIAYLQILGQTETISASTKAGSK